MTTESSQSPQPIYEGECFCKAVAFTCSGAPDWSLVCHCSICARLAGASGVDLVAWKGNDCIKITRGLDSVAVVMSSPQMRRSFCKCCGSPLVSTSLLPDMAFQDVPISLFKRDDAGRIMHWDVLKPTSHIFYRSRVRNFVDDLPKWDSYPGVGVPLTVDAQGNVVDAPDADAADAHQHKVARKDE
jgi:hypothetical protein